MSFPTQNYFVIITRKSGWLMFIAVLILTTACASNTDTTTPTPCLKIFFPQQDAVEGEREAMTALNFGTLVVVDDCLRLNDDESDTSWLLIWPPDFTLNTENDVIQILNGEGKVTAHVGDKVRVDGGEVWSFSLFNESMQEKLPSHCLGPYWIVGFEVSTLEESE
jgi:hypothetical protein